MKFRGKKRLDIWKKKTLYHHGTSIKWHERRAGKNIDCMVIRTFRDKKKIQTLTLYGQKKEASLPTESCWMYCIRTVPDRRSGKWSVSDSSARLATVLMGHRTERFCSRNGRAPAWDDAIDFGERSGRRRHIILHLLMRLYPTISRLEFRSRSDWILSRSAREWTFYSRRRRPTKEPRKNARRRCWTTTEECGTSHGPKLVTASDRRNRGVNVGSYREKRQGVQFWRGFFFPCSFIKV